MIENTRRNNKDWKRVCGGLLAVLLTMSLAGCGGGGGNANNTNTTATNTATTNTNANANTNPNANASASAAASDASLKEAAMTWGHIEEARVQLDKAVEANNLNLVHDATVKIRDSINALPGKSAALPADKRETLNSQVKEVDGLARMLGEAGDSRNMDALHQHHMALSEALDRMKGLYPDGMDMMEKGMDRMKMGKEMMDKGTMDKGMDMMDEGMDMMEMGKDMMSDDKMDKDAMDEGMDMMEMGKEMMGKGKDKMDKSIMDKGMHMMENGMHMMDKGMKKGDKKMPMEKKSNMKKKGMAHM